METVKGDLTDLRCLCAVIEHESITLAAKIMGESKGSVSRRITRLEQQLEVKLLDRSSRKILPTVEGKSFYHRSLQALALLDEGATELQNANSEPSGLLRVQMPIDLGLSIFPPLLAEFLGLYPKIDIEVMLDEAVLDLKTHQIDIVIRLATNLPDSADILHRLTTLSGHLFASPQYLQQHGNPETLLDLQQHSILLHKKCNNSMIFRHDNSIDRLDVKPRLVANDFAYLQEMAIAGAGITLIPSFLGNIGCRSGQLMPILPQYSVGSLVPLYLLHQGWRLLPTKVTCFRDFMCDRFKTMDFHS